MRYNFLTRLFAFFMLVVLLAALAVLVVSLVNPALAQGPIAYSVARTDQKITQPPNPLPTWGPAGSKWCNPAFNNLCVVRLTDAATDRGFGLGTADSGSPRLWASDSKHVVLSGPRRVIVSFDPVLEKPGKTPLSFAYPVQFSNSDPQVMFGLDGTKIKKLVANAQWTAVTQTVLFDFATPGCLGAGFKPNWRGTFSLALDDKTFKTAYSNTGAQGTGIYAVAWSAAKGCWVYNTLAGTVTGPSGTSSIDDGLLPLADRFYLHEAGAGQSGDFALLTPTLHTAGGKPGCVAGHCQANMPYVWEVHTSHVRPCGPYHCDGHAAQGAVEFLTGSFYRVHDYARPSIPLTKLTKFPAGMGDNHGSWHNTDGTDRQPAFLTTTDTTPVKPYPTWGYDEVMAVATDASQKVWRFGQTFNTGTSKYFVCANSNGVVSGDGKWVVFTSDMGAKGALGYLADGTPRCDAFVLEIK